MAFFCPQKSSSPVPLAPPEPSHSAFKRPLPLLPQDVTITLEPGPAPPRFNPLALSLRQYIKDGIRYHCRLCTKNHDNSKGCPSKPPRHPSLVFRACDICNGHHPPKACYFEELRQSLYTPSPCSNCKGLVHAWFCTGNLQCKKCNTRHNGLANCPRRELTDISNNLCPSCNTFHIHHCPSKLKELDIPAVLWCNLCKLHHAFMKCTPFCSKCFRHHIESPSCPSPTDFCQRCMVSHFGTFCPRNLDDLPLTYPQELGIQVQQNNEPTYIITTPEKQRHSAKRKPSTSLSPSKHHSNSPESSISPPTPPNSENIYLCPDNCTCDDCKPVRFLSRTRNPTPLPTFKEVFV